MVSSRMASVYSIVVHAACSMPEIAVLVAAVSRTVTDTSAPPASTARTAGPPKNAESIRTRTGRSAPSRRRACLTASPISRAAPRGEPQAPLRTRCATITGARPVTMRVARIALSPRTREYPNPAPCFWWPWTSMMVSSTSSSAYPPLVPVVPLFGSLPPSNRVSVASASRNRAATASSWRTCPKVMPAGTSRASRARRPL